MKTEHQHLEEIAVNLDYRADDLFCRIANDEFTVDGKRDADTEAQAYRRAAEIIRHQIECEA